MRPAITGVPFAMLVPAAVLASGFLLAGCSSGDSTAAQPSGPPNSASLLNAGDCIRLAQTASNSQSIEIADCAARHHGEVVLAQDDYFSTSKELPNEDMLNATADQACSEGMFVYSKRKPDQTPFRMSYLYPTQETWAEGDRKLTCIAVAYDTEFDSLMEVDGSIHAVQ